MDGYVQDFRITNSSSLLKKEEDFFHPRKFERFLRDFFQISKRRRRRTFIIIVTSDMAVDDELSTKWTGMRG